ncbi:DUF2007 domain-containing protein [Actinophytocola sp.]|uniref:putative signal transducing protein n=1 Tax=Actinophytocola sp. TaxID=1872138 RepID=UPI002ED30B64
MLERYAVGNERGAAMVELLRSNDPVLISFAASLLDDAKIKHTVADSNISVIEGSIGAVVPRILVADEQHAQARELLTEAGLEDSLRIS